VFACLVALVVGGACGRKERAAADKAGIRPAATTPAAGVELEAAESSGAGGESNSFLSAACLRCARGTCGMVISLCTSDPHCVGCLQGDSCAGVPLTSQRRARDVCNCITTSCYAPCFRGLAPKPVCPGAR